MKRQSQPIVDFRDATVEDLMANPTKYGCPTFQEFQQNYSKWRLAPREDDAMITLTDGPQKFRKDLRKIIFKVNGFEMPQEKVEIALGDHGYSLADIDLDNRNSRLKKDIQMVDKGGGKYDVVVNFLP